MERKRKVTTSQGVQFVVDDDVIKAMEEQPSVSMGCPVERSVCSICGIFDTKCTHIQSNENRVKDVDIDFHMISFVSNPDPGCELKYTEPNKKGDSFSVEKFKEAFSKLK